MPPPTAIIRQGGHPTSGPMCLNRPLQWLGGNIRRSAAPRPAVIARRRSRRGNPPVICTIPVIRQPGKAGGLPPQSADWFAMTLLFYTVAHRFAMALLFSSINKCWGQVMCLTPTVLQNLFLLLRKGRAPHSRMFVVMKSIPASISSAAAAGSSHVQPLT